ncbi:MAG TPA: sigma-70 family RNA polymerase sigma factor [Bryobacteraceae bacterium]|nr:sigma-70 family RNA polymerase sigma factor [Bryobacteraceae bacterium]
MDEDIRARLEEGQYRQAFELLMPRYQHKVFRLAYSMLGNRALAEETTQDIFIRIWKALAGYRGQSSLSTWIYSVARNTCLTALKRNAASLLPLEAIRVDSRVGGSSEHGIDWQRLLSQLPEKYRQVLVLFYMQDKSYDEVARLLDLPMGTVKTNLHRARKELAAVVLASRLTEGGR